MTPTLLGTHEQLRGEVLGLVEVDPDDAAMGMVELVADAGGPAVRCTGPVADLVEGQCVTVVGHWQQHRRHGWSFEAVFYERIAPERVAASDGWMRSVAPVRWPADVASAVHERFGPRAPELARTDPYGLLAVDRVRFGHVDELGRHLRMPMTDPGRVRAAATAAVAASRRAGHEHLAHDALVAATARLAGVDRLIAADAVAAAVTQGTLATERIDDREVVSTPGALRAERDLAAGLLRLLRAERPRLRERLTELAPDGLGPAVRATFSCPVSVLTGGRGTGAARAVTAIVRTVEGVGLRLGEDLVIADAAACGDTESVRELVAGIGDGAHLLVVGDLDLQVPEGPGQVLRDLVDSGVVPVTSFTEPEAPGPDPAAPAGRIVGLAREVLAGEVGVLRGADGDVFLAEEPPHGDPVRRVVRAVTRRIPEHLGVDLDGIQVLTPRDAGPLGAHAVDAAIADALGGPDRPSMARAIHRTSGRTWPVAVVVVDVSDRGVVDRRMLYTAVTRAERALIVVGQEQTVRAAARWQRPVDRHTGLRARLRR